MKAAASRSITSRRRVSNAPAGCAIPFFLVFAAVGLGMIWFLTVKPFLRVLDAKTWPEVPATVVESHVDSSSDSDGTTYRAIVTYHYLYEGRELESTRYDFSTAYSSGYEGKAEIVAQYPAGARTVCYVDPTDPTEAVLSRTFSPMYLIGLFGLLFAGPGLLGLVWVLNGMGKKKPANLAADPASPFGVSDPQAGVDGPVELRPQSTPFGKLVGLTVAALLWNGFIGAILFIVFQKENRPEGCLIAFLALFALIGLFILYGAIRQFLVLFNPRPKLTLSPGSLPLGGTVYLQWRLSGGTGGVRRLKVTLEGREEAQYRQGTSTRTDKEVFAVMPLVDTTDPYLMANGSTSFTVPESTLPSFRSEHNKIVWTIKAELEIANWPDSEEEFEVLVRPEGSRRP